MASFDPDYARAVLEAGLRDLFSPADHLTGASYAKDALTTAGGQVYRALIGTAQDPPGVDWTPCGPAYPLLYDNVAATIGGNGALRLSISWGKTEPMAIRCLGGQKRRVSGVLTCWIYTPANQGTRAGLLAIKRLRDGLEQWNLPGVDPNGTLPSGHCVRVTELNGPRSSGPSADLDFYSHNLTATLTVEEEAKADARPVAGAPPITVPPALPPGTPVMGFDEGWLP